MRWFLGLALCAGTASADPLPDLFDVLSEIQGREVSVSGLLGDFDRSGPHLNTDDGIFDVTYAVARDVLKRAEQCKIGMFSNDEACPVRVKAELRRDSTSFELIVYDIEFLNEYTGAEEKE